jgi:hypothetical protein
MLKTILFALVLGAAALAPPPVIAQTSAQPTLHLPHRSDVTGSARRRTTHRNTLNRQRARATSEHARQIRRTQ